MELVHDYTSIYRVYEGAEGGMRYVKCQHRKSMGAEGVPGTPGTPEVTLLAAWLGFPAYLVKQGNWK